MPRHRDHEDEDDDDRPARRRRRDEDDEGVPDDAPRVYVHEECGGQTEMPEEIIAEYLDNPFELGETPDTYCTRCKGNVPLRDCTWVETDQNCYEYLDDLRAERFIAGDDPRGAKVAFNWIGFGIVVTVAVVGAVMFKEIGALPLRIGIGLAAGGIGGAGLLYYAMLENQKAFDEWNRKLVSRYYKRYPDRRKSKRR